MIFFGGLLFFRSKGEKNTDLRRKKRSKQNKKKKKEIPRNLVFISGYFIAKKKLFYSMIENTDFCDEPHAFLYKIIKRNNDMFIHNIIIISVLVGVALF